MFQSIVTVCDRKNKERCPIFPGHKHYIDWDLSDPELVEDAKDRLTAMRAVRDLIRTKVDAHHQPVWPNLSHLPMISRDLPRHIWRICWIWQVALRTSSSHSLCLFI